MTEVLEASARPAKRLFIDLLTRDIPLSAAFLDLLDNSINAATEPFANQLKNADGYLELYNDDQVAPSTSISLKLSENEVEIVDDASGISAEVAQQHAFRFGRDTAGLHPSDRLSVYGIGLKRAIFKLGNRIKIRSDHVEGGFDMDLTVSDWAKDDDPNWTFSISTRDPVAPTNTGTSIVVTELYDNVKRRITDGTFVDQLEKLIARTYEFYLAKLVTILMNGKEIAGTGITIGANFAAQSMQKDGVTCTVAAGIGVPVAGKFRDTASGWFVFCNGRAVVFADKSPLTGWSGAGLPIFQPKHRPFVGTVFFVSDNPELLPWTTTKAGINEDSAVWQAAKRTMAEVGRTVISFLDSRYTDEGTEIASKDLQVASEAEEAVGVLAAATSSQRSFKAPTPPRGPRSVSIQYHALVDEVRRIATYLNRPSMSGSDVGRHTFSHFLKHEVEGD